MSAASRIAAAAAAGMLLAVMITAGPAPHAAADPPGFPDLSTFTAVDPAPHITHYVRAGSAVGFATPAGVQCSWPAGDDPDFRTYVTCSGDIPGIPASVPETAGTGCAQVTRGGGLTGSTILYVFTRHGGYHCPPFPATLAVGEKMTAAGITCAVVAGAVTACINPVLNHGFVLRPAGSWVF